MSSEVELALVETGKRHVKPFHLLGQHAIDKENYRWLSKAAVSH